MSSSDIFEIPKQSTSQISEGSEDQNKEFKPSQNLEKSGEIGEVEAQLLKELVEMACVQIEKESQPKISEPKKEDIPQGTTLNNSDILPLLNKTESIRPTECSSLLKSEELSLNLISEDQSNQSNVTAIVVKAPEATEPTPQPVLSQIQKAPLLHQQLIQFLASPSKGNSPQANSSPSLLARPHDMDKRGLGNQEFSPSQRSIPDHVLPYLQRPKTSIAQDESSESESSISQGDLATGRSIPEIPKSPLIRDEVKRTKFPDRPITPQFPNMDHPVSPAGSSGGGSKVHMYNRRRHSRLYPQYDNNHCLYQVHHCPDPVLPGTLYCVRHQSETSPQFYGQCSYIYLINGHRCKNFKITRDDKNGLCELHATRISMRKKALKRGPKVPETAKTILTKISEIVDANAKGVSLKEVKDENSLPPEDVNPEAYLKMEHFARFQTELDSDCDFDDMDEYYPLRTAGFYSTEEIVKIYRSKLHQLKNLYIKQLEFLKFEYKEKRRLYLQAEAEMAGAPVTRDFKRIVVNDEASAEYFAGQVEAYEETKALLAYHHKRGFKTYFQHLAKKTHQEQLAKEGPKKKFEEMGNEEKRQYFIELARKDGLNLEHSSPPRIQICSYSGNSVHCKERVLPLTKFCQAHILNDLNQKLFGACKRVINEDGDICGICVLNRLDDSYCDLHKVIKVRDIPETEIEKKQKHEWEEKHPEANLNDEIRILEELVINAVIDDKFLEFEIQHILAKGLDKDDTSDSEEEDDDSCIEKPEAPLASGPAATTTTPAVVPPPVQKPLKKPLKRQIRVEEEEEDEEEEAVESDEDYIFEEDELLDV